MSLSISLLDYQLDDNVLLDVNQEVDKYLADLSDTLTSLDSCPHVRQLYIMLNTGLPSSD